MLLTDTLGWIGSAFVVYAFTMNIYGKLASSSSLYISLNIVGSIFLIINTYFHAAYPSMAVNIIWVVISMGAFLKIKK